MRTKQEVQQELQEIYTLIRHKLHRQIAKKLMACEPQSKIAKDLRIGGAACKDRIHRLQDMIRKSPNLATVRRLCDELCSINAIADGEEIMQYWTKAMRTPLSSIIDVKSGEVCGEPEDVEMLTEIKVTTKGTTYKSHDRLAASKLLFEAQGLGAAQRVEVEHSGTVAITKEQLQEAAQVIDEALPDLD